MRSTVANRCCGATTSTNRSVRNGKRFKTRDLDRGRDNSDIRRTICDGSDDLVAEPFLQIDVHLRMRHQEVAERLGQKFGQRIGIGQQPNLSLDALGILRKFAVHPLRLLQQQTARDEPECDPAGVGCTPWRSRCSKGMPSAASMLRMRVLAAAIARCIRSAPCVMLPASTTCRNSRKSLRSKRIAGRAFGSGEARLRELPIVSIDERHQISANTKAGS